MTTEQLIQVLREQGYTLDLVSLDIRIGPKYSAKFFHIYDTGREECCSNTPNDWDAFAHAETMEEVILRAAQDLGDRCPVFFINTGESA